MGDLVLVWKSIPRLAGLTISSSRVPTWNPGVEGGIPDTSGWDVYDVTSYGAVGNGSTDDSTAIKNTISAASGGGGGIVYFPSGTYFCSQTTGRIVVPSNVLLKGATPTSTTWPSAIKLGNSGGNTESIVLGSVAAEGSEYTVSGSVAAGATSITFTSAPAWSSDDWVVLYHSVRPPGCDNTERSWTFYPQLLQVLSVDGSTVTFKRAVKIDYSNTYAPKARKLPAESNLGIENLYIYNVDYHRDRQIWLQYAVDCWIRNCKFGAGPGLDEWFNAVVLCNHSAQVTIRHCYFDCQVVNTRCGWYNAVSFADSTDCICEDSVISEAVDSWYAQTGASGCVFAYNYCPAITGVAWNTHHGILLHGWNSHSNLIEGNACQVPISLDHYWGPNGPYNIIFRNRVWGAAGGKSTARPINEETSSAPPYPTWGASHYTALLLNACYAITGTAYTPPLPGHGIDRYADYYWLERNIYENCMSLVPQGTTTSSDNYNGTSAPGAWAGTTFTRSLYLPNNAKPSWWTAGKAWPCIGADVDDMGGTPTKIPAEDWYDELTA